MSEFEGAKVDDARRTFPKGCKQMELKKNMCTEDMQA
jgi:hypothetical protein